MPRPIKIEFVNRARGAALDPLGIAQTLRDADRELKFSDRFDSVSVVFVTGEGIRTLKREWLGIDRETDVLSFPAGETPPGLPRPLGEIVLCPEYLAPRFPGAALPRRARQLALHGVLHLLGFDHEADEGEMNRLEKKLRRRLGLG